METFVFFLTSFAHNKIFAFLNDFDDCLAYLRVGIYIGLEEMWGQRS